MKMIYTNKTLYVDIEERINFSMVKKLKSRLFHLIDSYAITNIELNILNNEHYDMSLINELLDDYNRKYNGKLIIK